MAFRGTFDYTLDAKNRLTIPARFRTSLADGVVLAKGLERCLAVWRPDDYERMTGEALAQFPPLSPEARSLQRFFFNSSHDTELDSAGRVMVPAFLMEHAGFGREVVVTGSGDHLDVWDKRAFADYDAELPAEVSRITARLAQTS